MAFSVLFYFLLLSLTHFLIQQPSPFYFFFLFNLFRHFHSTTVIAFLRLFYFLSLHKSRGKGEYSIYRLELFPKSFGVKFFCLAPACWSDLQLSFTSPPPKD